MGQNSGVEVKKENVEGAKVSTLSDAAEKVKMALIANVEPELEKPLKQFKQFESVNVKYMKEFGEKNMKWLLNRIHKGESNVEEIQFAIDWCNERIEEIEGKNITEEEKIIVKNYYRKTINILNLALEGLKAKVA